MTYLNNLKIGTRLVLTLGILIAMMVVVGLQSIAKSGSVESKLIDITERRMTIMEDMNDLRLEVNRQARAIRNMALLNNPEQIKAERNAVMQSRQKSADIRARVDGLIRSPKGREIWTRGMETGDKFRSGVDQYFKIFDEGQKDQAPGFLINDLRPIQAAYLATLNEQIELQKELTHAASKEAVNEVSTLQMTIWVSTGVSLLVAVVLGLWIVRSITRPINQSVDVARAVAAGDLSMTFQAQSQDETGQLLRALSEMQGGLARVVGTVRQGSESVATASAQIAQGNQDLSARTESQASALEETAASMEELSSTVTQNADNARQANQLAQSASGVAIKGGEVVAQVVDTMRGISDSSRKIADIINVIDGIAFQTNILALNAAVEAARAGEQGRGFAVVAGEVRNLASRSAEAAKEIKQLITDSVSRVEHGTALVDEAGSTMNEIVSSIRRVTDIMGEISAASTEQSQGVAQIGEAVQQMDQVTQQNAALVEEMAAAANSLRSQAQDLVQAVAVFKLGQGSAIQAPAASLAPALTPRPAASVPTTARPAAKPAIRKSVPAALPAETPVKATDAGGEWESF